MYKGRTFPMMHRTVFCPQCGAHAESACEIIIPECAAVSCPRGCPPFVCLCKNYPPGYPSLPFEHTLHTQGEQVSRASASNTVIPWPSPICPRTNDDSATRDISTNEQQRKRERPDNRFKTTANIDISEANIDMSEATHLSQTSTHRLSLDNQSIHDI